jgi:alkylation response protein AidB-like acyl-CoA dehydrogenase
MNFGLTEEQQILVNVARRFLDERAPIAKVRDIMESDSGFDPALWSGMAELGWLGLTIDQDHGGTGLGWVDLAVLLEETGRGLLPSPLVSHSLAATAISEFGSDEQKRRLLPSLADGSAIGAAALLESGEVLGPGGIELTGTPDGGGYRLNGKKTFVQDAGVATVFVVAFRAPDDVKLGVLNAEADGVQATGHMTMDQTKRMGDLVLENATITADNLFAGDGAEALSRLLDLGAVAVTAEMVGAMDRAHEITTQYAKDRTQFGAQIGKYQGVKHPLAEMYVDIETSRSLVYYAAWCVGERPEELPIAAARAKAYTGDAFKRLGVDVVKLHGAIGFTAEYDIQLYLKRSKWAFPAYGDPDYHYERITDDLVTAGGGN